MLGIILLIIKIMKYDMNSYLEKHISYKKSETKIVISDKPV